MKVVFRADASRLIGTGHVMRCLTLADALAKHGAQCEFICREQPGNLIGFISGKGYPVHILPRTGESKDHRDATEHGHFLGCSQQQDALECAPILSANSVEWLVVDHYGLDHNWESILLPHFEKLMVIDDLADRQHQCDLLLDQTFGRPTQDYEHWVPSSCTLLCGAQYSLLRPEFNAMRSTSLARRKSNSQLKNLLITMGGVDKDNATCNILNSLRESPLPADTHITVVMGASAPWLAEVKDLAEQMPWPTTVQVNAQNMAELMQESDLAIGAAGATAWERCCLGLPCLMLVLADNQRLIADKLNSAGAALTLDTTCNISNPLFDSSTLSSEKLSQMSQKAAAITDGLGVQHILKHLSQNRVAP